MIVLMSLAGAVIYSGPARDNIPKAQITYNYLELTKDGVSEKGAILMDNNCNCHGCKWLDENKKTGLGTGYCCMVVNSQGYRNGDRVRHTDSTRCDLYKEGDFKNRYRQV